MSELHVFLRIAFGVGIWLALIQGHKLGLISGPPGWLAYAIMLACWQWPRIRKVVHFIDGLPPEGKGK
jgi:hypothetical protein